jgi:predicted AAA+ superfamily ATPase
MGGAIFETAVLSEIIKTIRHRGQGPQVYFWRTAAGAEVDIVVAEGGQLIPLAKCQPKNDPSRQPKNDPPLVRFFGTLFITWAEDKALLESNLSAAAGDHTERQGILPCLSATFDPGKYLE